MGVIEIQVAMVNFAPLTRSNRSCVQSGHRGDRNKIVRDRCMCTAARHRPVAPDSCQALTSQQEQIPNHLSSSGADRVEDTNALAAAGSCCIKCARTSAPTSNAVAPIAGPNRPGSPDSVPAWQRPSAPARHRRDHANPHVQSLLRFQPDHKTAPASNQPS